MHKKKRSEELGDFTTGIRVIPISCMAIVIGFIATLIAWFLLKLIGIFTNLFYYHRFDTALSSPAGNHLGLWAVAVPVIGSLIVGIMARYGSEKIRGHGIPEAIEAILMNGSRIEPRLAMLKPISAAISIGSGGPFGAEGPIIMTGGAFGSLIAQFFHLTSAERKTLLVAGAAAGMAATFAAPLAAILLAVELLLFEWKPRSAIPVALASATAGAARRYILGLGPLFPVPSHPAFIGPVGLLGCVLTGVAAGGLSALLTVGVYAAEDAFHKLPIHWMWWPAIGGVFVGIGGLIFPQALGVGYDTIGLLLHGNVAVKFLMGVLFVKSAIWVISLGSGTSGGVLAPLLMMGAALGGIEGLFLPHFGEGFWPLVSMGAILGGTMRSPFTGIIFALELTHDFNMLLPLIVACFLAHGFTVLVLKRSILTEKISRRGYHLSREYALDPLEILFVREVMRTNVVALPADASLEQARELIRPTQRPHGQHLFPVLDEEKHVIGVVSRNHLAKSPEDQLAAANQIRLRDIATPNPVVAFADEPLRVVVYRMVETGFTRFPVMDADNPKRLVGMVALQDLLRARTRNLEEERDRERVFRLRIPTFSRKTSSPRSPAIEEVTEREDSDIHVG
ncbi:MAG: chloride channel protein [Acidobacteriota bacterium]|nr:chloride channel protein [Acidobacteriota bacterium]